MAYIGNSPVQDETVTSAQIVDGAIVDADVNSSAAIAFSKMANLTASRVLVSDGSGDVSVSDVTSAETLILDGGTSATSTTLAAADRVIVNDNGTMVQVALSDFETFFEGAIDTLSSAMTFSSTVTVGSDGSGQDVIFYSGTSGDNFTWDSSEECLTITGTDGAQALKVADGDLVVVDKLYIYDNDGGEYLSGDGTTLTITAGAASTVKLDANSKISLSNNDSGTSNTILGKSAGASLDAGSNYNVFIGEAVSDASMNDAVYNVGIGYQALTDLTEGDYNICIGGVAGENITTGSQNVLIGTSAGDGLIAETDNIAIGHDAMSHTDPQADRAIAIGSGSLGGNLTSAADGVVAIGYTALAALTSGTGNVAVGYQAGNLITTATNNTYVGYGAGDATHVDASSTTAIGSGAFGGTHTGTVCHYNVAVGNNALAGAMNGVDGAVAVGTSALQALTTGVGNVAIGYQAGLQHETGHRNTVIGHEAMYNTQLNSGPATSDNIFIGYRAGSGEWSSAASPYNVGIGNSSLAGDMNGAINNVGVGYESLSAVTTGDSNVAIGFQAGNTITTGNGCILIGNDADSGAVGAVDRIVIGPSVTGTADNSVRIGDSGNSATLDFSGSSNSWSSTSDARVKRDIVDTDLGLEFVNKLRPIKYKDKPMSEWPEEFQIKKIKEYPDSKDRVMEGLIAQEVKATCDELGVTFSGWTESELTTRQRLQYEKLVMPLIKAVQELSQQVEDLKKKVGD